MRKFVSAAVITTILCLFAVCGYSREMKTGYVDILGIFNDYQKTAAYENALEEKKRQKEEETNLQQKKEEIIKMQDKLDLLKEKEQAEQKEKIRKAITEYRTTEQQVFQDLKKESDEKMKEILADINTAIEEYAKKNGFDMIINKSAILYGAESINVTQDVLKILNKEYKK